MRSAPDAAGLLRRVSRAAAGQQDDRALRIAVLETLRGTVPFDWFAWVLTDPVTQVGTSPVAHTPDLADLPRLIHAKYATAVGRWTDLGDSFVSLRDLTGGDPSRSLLWREVLNGYGVHDVASGAFRDAQGCWAFLDLWRRDAPFTTAELACLTAIRGELTRAIRLGQAAAFASLGAAPASRGPAVMLLSPRLDVLAGTPASAEHLRTVLPTPTDRQPVPACAYNVAAQLLAHELGVSASPALARMRAGTQLVTLRAARVDDATVAATGRTIAVSIETASGSDRLELFTRCHGLTPRESELLAHLGAGREAAVEVTARREASAAVRLSVQMPAREPHVLIPGAFYGENRPAGNDRIFPRFEIGASSAVDHQGLVSDEWHLRVDRAATPVVMAWTGPGEVGLALATEEVGELGEQALGFAARDGVVRLSMTAPLREFPICYLGDGVPHEPEVRHHAFTAGERVRLRVRLYPLTADRHDHDRLLRLLHTGVEPPEPWVGLDEAARIAAEGLVRWHFDPDPGVLLETVGFDRGIGGNDGKPVDRQAMHVGWVSGIPWAFALLAHAARTGDADAERAGRSVIDLCCRELSPSGTFWGVWYRDRGWTQSWTPLRRGLHARTIGEATDFLLRALELHEVPAWRAAARSNLDAMVARQRADGNLGLVHHAETGEVMSWSGSAPLAWVPALLRARTWDERYLEAAVRAGEYYARFVEEEWLHGAPEDVDLAPTSEDGYVAVMAYAALHRATGEPRWLVLARRAAEWTFTFRYSYDVTFGPRTPLGVYGFRTTGSDQASSSNQHGHAYGLICTDELLELSEHTGDDWYRRRALETLACFRQLLPVADGDLNAYRGMVTERYYQTDCFQPKGMILGLSHAWSAGVLLLGCEQAISRGLS